MNKEINKKDFMSRFKGSQIEHSPKTKNLARSVLGALSIAAFSASIPALASENSSTPSIASQEASQSSQYNVGDQAKKLDFETFKEISAEKRSGIYQHPYNKGEVVTLFMVGDNSPLSKINADWEKLKGEPLPPALHETAFEYQKALKGAEGKTNLLGENMTNFVNVQSSSEANLVIMDTVFSQNKGKENTLNAPDRDKAAYFAMMHQVGLSAAPQKLDVIDLALNKMRGVGDVGVANGANFSSVIMTAKGLMDSGVSDTETLSFMNEIKAQSEVGMSKVANTDKNSFYSGQAATNLAIEMIKENPEKIKNITPENLALMSESIVSLTEGHDFSNDQKAQILLESNNEKLLSKAEELQSLSKSDPKAYQGAMRGLITELNTVIDGLIKQQYGENGLDSEAPVKLNSFADFNAGALAKFSEDGLWEKGAPLEPDFPSIDVDLDTEILEIVLDNTKDVKAIVWEPGVDRTPVFLDKDNQHVLEMAKKYSFDINDSPESKRIDLFFKDEDKTSLSLTLDNSCVTPEFFDSSVRLLEQERFDNISKLKECDSPQLNGAELERGYSSYNQHELIIQEINYSQTHDEPNLAKLSPEPVDNKIERPRFGS